MTSSHNHTFNITLTMANGSDHRRIILEAGQKTEVGRASKSENRNAVAAPDNALFDCPVVSRNHAELAYHPFEVPGKEVNIKDLGSKHGTVLNGKRLVPNVHYDLHSGDQIKFGGPITVGAESHDGITMMYSPNVSPPLSEAREAQLSTQRGFRAPSYESDNDDVNLSLDYAGEFDKANEEVDEDFIDDDDCDDNDDDDDDEDEDDEDDNQDNGIEQENDSTSQTTPEEPKTFQPYNVHPPIYLRHQLGMAANDTAAGANAVIIPDSMDALIPTNTYRPGSSSLHATAHASRSTLWPGDTPMSGDGKGYHTTNKHLDVSDAGSDDEPFWPSSPNKPTGDKSETRNLNGTTRDSDPPINACMPCPLQATDGTGQTCYRTKPRYDPVRSSPAATVNQFPSYPTAGTGISHIDAPEFLYESPQICPALSQQKKSDPLQESLVTDSFPDDYQRQTLASSGPSSVDTQTAHLQEPFPLPAVDDVVQSLTWMDQPNHPISFNKIPIPVLMERPGKKADKQSEINTENESSTLPSMNEKRRKRKADDVDESVSPAFDKTMTKKARTEAKQPVGNRYGVLKGMIIGAVGGAIGTMAFLASPATDMLLDWLEA